MKNSLSMCAHSEDNRWVHSGKAAVYTAGTELSPGPKLASTLIDLKEIWLLSRWGLEGCQDKLHFDFKVIIHFYQPNVSQVSLEKITFCCYWFITYFLFSILWKILVHSEERKKKCLLHIEFSLNHCLKTLYNFLLVFTSEPAMPFNSW